MSIIRIRYVLITGFATILFKPSITTAAASEDAIVNDYISFLSSANAYSPAEGAGSHGSIGFGLGIGASAEKKPENTALIDDQLRTSDQFANKESSKQTDQVVIPRAFFHKGLLWPVDFGFGIGRIGDLQATTAGGYVQWTIYESFAMPAIAARLKHSRLMGLPSTEFSSTAIEGIVSHGFRLFTVYGTYALNQHNAAIRTSGESGTSIALSEVTGSDYKISKRDRSYTYGLQVQLLPPICNVAVENRMQDGQSSLLAKLSLGM